MSICRASLTFALLSNQKKTNKKPNKKPKNTKNKKAYDFLIAIAEPVCRPEAVHEYVLTPHSLYAAVSVGLETETILSVLNRLSKVPLSREAAAFIRKATQNYGKAKLVLKRNRFWVESGHAAVLRRLLADPVVQAARETVMLSTEMGRSAALKAARHASVACYQSDDAQEGPLAFSEKRRPNWTGK